MGSWLPGLLGDDSDSAWEWFGKRDPYYGVVTAPRFRRENLNEDGLSSFFRSGETHVERVLRIIEEHFGRLDRGTCLDFGCGVGRLLLPFAHRFASVAGVDVSPSMLAEAKRNCARVGVTNAAFYSSLAELPGRFDLVHTYTVLQHVPTRRGRLLIEQLVNKTAPGGICFLHFTTLRSASRWRRWRSVLRKNIKPLHYALNLVNGRRLTEAYMQVNEYDLNRITARLFDRGIQNLWLESENHEGPYSVCLAFRVP